MEHWWTGFHSWISLYLSSVHELCNAWVNHVQKIILSSDLKKNNFEEYWKKCTSFLIYNVHKLTTYSVKLGLLYSYFPYSLTGADKEIEQGMEEELTFFAPPL